MEIALTTLALVAIGSAIAATERRIRVMDGKPCVLWAALTVVGVISFFCLAIDLVMLLVFYALE
jgi:hypothetical protein